MNIWLDKVSLTDGSAFRHEDENIVWLAATEVGVRVCREQPSPTIIIPWHRVHSCVEQE